MSTNFHFRLWRPRTAVEEKYSATVPYTFSDEFNERVSLFPL